MDFLHVGMKVADIRASSALFAELFGITWEPVREYRLQTVTLEGSVSPSTTLVTHGTTASGVEIEMVQVTDGRTADELVLGDREGLSHIAFTVADLDAAAQGARHRGLHLVSEYRSDDVDFAFFASPQLGGVLAQLVQFKQPRPGQTREDL
jgi:catechol 2,3-dioxygenase-like lactoylglutathione lyase family enzyme